MLWGEYDQRGLRRKTEHGIRIGMPKSDVMNIVIEDDLLGSRTKPELSDDHWILNGMNIDFREDQCSGITIGITNYLPKKD